MSDPTNFDGSNLIMRAPEGAENVQDMHVFQTRRSCVSCWNVSGDELAEINATGKIFLSVLMGGKQPPVYVGSESTCRAVMVDFGPVWPMAPRPMTPAPSTQKPLLTCQCANSKTDPCIVCGKGKTLVTAEWMQTMAAREGDHDATTGSPSPQTNVAGQSARLWPGQTVETVIKEMIAVSAGEYDGYDEIIDPWTSDNRADIDRWQCILSDALTPSPQTNTRADPDYCFDPAEWEFTCDWSDRDQVHGHGDGLNRSEPMRVCTLLKGPDKWVADVPVTWDEHGDPDETEVKWFDSEEEARAALAATTEGQPDA